VSTKTEFDKFYNRLGVVMAVVAIAIFAGIIAWNYFA
jgi:hypothetical protein